ncbi:T9SS-dependent M36 family metallopeptidase [Chryseobacterium sp. MIQD13]|uniref:T9SS-dependent M36 family metallopeptidase n=1 Tax=Chryseobacterium sp. MIQD13 TaxID=3422310 RepID=UPI003D27AB72
MNKRLFLLPISMAAFFAFSNMNAQNSKTLVQDYYKKSNQLNQKNNTNNANVDVIILNEDLSASLGANIVNVQQTYKGLRVYNALGKVIIKGDKIVSEKNDFNRNITVASQGNAVDKFSDSTLKQNLGLSDISKVDYLPNIYFEKNGVYVLAKEIFVSDKNSSDVWHVIADAGSGEVLVKNNMTLSCNFEKHDTQINESKTSMPLDSESLSAGTLQNTQGVTLTNLVNTTLLPSNASYNVFPLPTEAPTFGPRTILSNPWDLTASPEGWHSDGTNNYTITRGNNVYAYSDKDNTNTPGYSPDGGASLNFDFPYAEGRYINPFNYKDAAITNLFYMNNKVHDVFYKFGFTETARNYQTNNFANGGIGGDAVNAEGFDGSGLGNANFHPGYETVISGTTYLMAPRMQMYLWDRAQTTADPISRYQYNSPANIASRPKVISYGAAFGPLLFDGQTVTGNLALSTPADACTAVPAGSLTGKIAVVTAANCAFTVKTKNLQNAGAIGVIEYHPFSDTPQAMGGTDATITIPSIMVGKTEGQYLAGQITAGTVINATLAFDYNGFKHSSLDNGIMVHEYGHGISNRLTGPGYGCLSETNSAEQMGEGWSDFFALMLTARPGDTSSLARSMGTYAKDQPTTGVGLRPAKYSPDFTVNNFTYGSTNTMTESHAIGFVWATMLWDLTWKYIEKYGYNNDVLASTTSGNAKVLQLVMDGLKLQACSPSFIDGRDAILQADVLGNAGADKCMIWKAFAKRGLGVNASTGSKTVMTDQVQDFTVPAECNTVLSTQDIKTADNKFIVFPNPTYDEFFVGNLDKSSQDVQIKIFDMSGKLVFSDSRDSQSKKAVSTKGFQKGVYMVSIKQGEKIQTEKLIVR